MISFDSRRAFLILSVLILSFGGWSPTQAADSLENISPQEAFIQTVALKWQVDASRMKVDWGRLENREWKPQDSIKIRSESKRGWFVVLVEGLDVDPMAARVRAGVIDTSWVTVRNLVPGEVLKREDVLAKEQLFWGPPQDQLLEPWGYEVRRKIAVDTALLERHLMAPELVATGEQITLRWTQGSVSVALRGVAQNSARLGEVVRARVEGRRDLLHGIAVEKGVARLQGEGSE